MMKVFYANYKHLKLPTVVIALALLSLGWVPYGDIKNALGQSEDAPKIIYFKSDKQQVVVGETATLSWRTENAEEVEISEIGSVETMGYEEVKPYKDTEYMLIARNTAGKTTSKAYVKVVVVRPVKPFAIDN